MNKELLKANKHFRETIFVPNNLGSLKAGQNPHTCWIGCSDSRVPAAIASDRVYGELFVHRNVANLVPVDTPAVGAVLEYAVDHLHVKHVVICGHYGCGGLAGLWRGLEKGSQVEAWMRHAEESLRRVRRIKGIAAMPEAKALKLLVEENLRVQRDHALKYRFVKEALNKKRITLDMMIYDLATGRLKELRK